MEIQIQSRNLHMTEALDSYVHKKLERLDRYLPNIMDVHVELARERTRRGEDLAVAQITVRHQRGALLRAQETLPGEIETAVNLAVDKIYRQVQRFKGKRVRKGHERFSATLEELDAAEMIPDVQLEGEIEEEAEVTRRKDVAIAAMSEDEAIDQMELLGHSFFIFFNPVTESMNVVYKRRAGGYGVINPRIE